MKKKKVMLSFNIDKDLKIKFQKIAIDKGMTMSEILGIIINSYIVKNKHPEYIYNEEKTPK